MSWTLESLEARQLLSSDLLADFGGICPTDSVKIGGAIYFVADDGVHGKELWKSPGTLAGTTLVADLTPGSGSTSIRDLVAEDGQFFFFVDGAAGKRSLWRSDGTAAGTYELISLATELPKTPHAEVNGLLVFVSESAVDGYDLWASDGTVAGTRVIQQQITLQRPDVSIISKSPIYSLGARAVLLADQVWSTDGTPEGTFALAAPVPYLPSGNAAQLGDILVYLEWDENKVLWATDGTVAGTKAIKTLPNSVGGLSQLSDNTVLMDISSATEQGYRDIWISDGTTAGTLQIAHIEARGGVAAQGRAGDRIVFVSVSPDPGAQVVVHVSDGTAAGTRTIGTILNEGIWVIGQASVGDVFYFLTQNDNRNLLLWGSDGTAEGTRIVQDLTDLTPQLHQAELTAVDGKLAVTLSESNQVLLFDPQTMSAPVGPDQATTSLRDGVLRVFGTFADDVIRVCNMIGSPDRFVVSVNGNKRSFATASVNRIYIYGYSGNDAIAVVEKYGKFSIRSRVWGGGGNDLVYAGGARDSLYGDCGDDTIVGGNNDDVIRGGDGGDSLVGGNGNDTAGGDFGADIVWGNKGDDVISGGDDDSNDHIDGNEGHNVLFGRAVEEIFYNGKPDDDGEALNDVLLGCMNRMAIMSAPGTQRSRPP